MIKHISKLIFTIAMYELGKWVTEQLIIWWQSDDELDAPLDFTDADHAHLNRLWREVSE
ncbi:transcriptional activator RinB [Staphylococcus warneri]|uniref:transcriptional activator RinB n=1 Tax=Staphylococcus sp. TaxID=29387 RepID=UPI000EEB4275|nr:transcriptional regulator [Staphylococcus sp.]HBY82149.1 transcriptional regulator [Staphylococcus sp.]